jgi:hypothetical protein
LKRCTFIAAIALLGCQSALERQPALIREERILAVSVDPAEASPGSVVSWRALAVSPNGSLTSEELSWSLCHHGRDVAENNSVAAECLQDSAPWIEPVTIAPASEAVAASLPDDACAIFGSEPEPPAAGSAPNRAADADASGGYYQPMRVRLDAQTDVAFGHARLRCALPSAPVEIARVFSERYVANQNPQLSEFAATNAIAAGSAVELRAAWDAAAREAYILYDPVDVTLLDVRESLEVAWFATAGSFSAERSLAEPGATFVSTSWSAPSAPGTVHLWAVLRDDRGGSSWLTLTLEVD